MRYHLAHARARIAIIKKAKNNKCWQECGEKGTLIHCSWEFVQPLWKILTVNCSVTFNSLQPHGLTIAHQAPLSMKFQAEILEWVAIPFFRGSSRPRDQTQISCTAGRFFTTLGWPKSSLIHKMLWKTLKELFGQPNSMLIPQRLTIELSCYQAIPLLGIHPQTIKTLIWKCVYSPLLVHCRIIYNSQKMETPEVLITEWMDKNVRYICNRILTSHKKER